MFRLAFAAGAAFLFLAGCSSNATDEKEVREARRQQMEAKAQAAMDAPVSVTKKEVDGNELLIFKVYFKDDLGLLVEQTCMAWRDKEFRTSSLRCSGQPVPANI